MNIVEIRVRIVNMGMKEESRVLLRFSLAYSADFAASRKNKNTQAKKYRGANTVGRKRNHAAMPINAENVAIYRVLFDKVFLVRKNTAKGRHINMRGLMFPICAQ